MDQTPDGFTGQPDDDFENAGQGTDLPLIIPGPHIIATQVPGQTKTADNLILNATANSIDVTFDRDMDPSTVSAADILSIVGPTGPVQLTPGSYNIALSPADTGNHRIFRITFPTQSLSGSYIVYLGADISAASSKALTVDRSLNAGLDTLRSVPSAGSVPITYSSSDSPTITKSSTITSIIHISDTYLLQSATVQVNITFPNDPDLEATLIAPDGTAVKLFTQVGNSGTKANFSNTIFDDNATTPIRSGGPPFFGRYNPQLPLAALAGKPAGGVGALGDWKLQIKNNSATNTGTLVNWKLTLVEPLSSTGLGEQVADRTPIPFRIFTMDKANKQSQNEWTALGPAGVANQNGAGRVSSIAVDPSDPTGNTVYVAGSGGGVWKTTNFLTHDAQGPTYVPLTDFGPTTGLSIGSIAVFPRNNDPDQTIIFAATGDGNIAAPGVGILRSLDGGKNWLVLDSKTNFDASGNPLPIAQRKHELVGTTAFKMIVDPQLSPTGDVIIYAALSNGTTLAGGGIWRSQDTGKTWQQMRAGNATDVVFDYNSVAADNNNLQTLYAGFRGEGVFTSPNRGGLWQELLGGVGDPLIQQEDVLSTPPVPVNDPDSTPHSATGRIVLAKPGLVPTNPLVPAKPTDNPAQDLGYQGYLYAAVANADGTLKGLYVTKDFGQNWTHVQLPNQDVLGTETNFGPGRSTKTSAF